MADKRKAPNPNQKRGQPTAAARLISSPYVNYGWHKPLSRNVKETVQKVSSAADSMYMLQIERTRPVDSLSLRNGIFWEHRQLIDQSIVSTPAVDHIDLFPIEDRMFEETRWKLSKDYVQGDEVLLHYLFEGMRHREFLILPVDIDGCWVTIIARTQQKNETNNRILMDVYTDREVTDLAIVDPLPENREARGHFIRRRLAAIFAEGCIELTNSAVTRDFSIPDIDSSEDDQWKTGLIAYAISREFLRRLKTLQWRLGNSLSTSRDREFLWGAFEEHYNFDNYRQSLMAACAHQCIEKSGFQVRLALEVPSEESNYEPENLGSSNTHTDEKWDFFQSPTHTLTLRIAARPWANSSPFHSRESSMSSFVTPRYNKPTPPRYSPNPAARDSPQCSPTTIPAPRVYTEQDKLSNSPIEQGPVTPKSNTGFEVENGQAQGSASSTSGAHTSSDADAEEDDMPPQPASYGLNAPVAQMTSMGFMAQIPGLNLIHGLPTGAPTMNQPYLQPNRDPVFAITPTGGLSPPPSSIHEEDGSTSGIPDIDPYATMESENRQTLATAVLENMGRSTGLKRSLPEDEYGDEEEQQSKRRRSRF